MQTPTFVSPYPLPTSSTSSNASAKLKTNPQRPYCSCCQRRPDAPTPPAVSSTRRQFLKWGALVLLAAVGQKSKQTRAEEADSEKKCDNCRGDGQISCELCLGTGFWRAISGSDPNLKYKGVVCPECEGSGTLACPVCLGTGEGNVKGLLRRRKVQPGPGRILQS